MVIPKKILNIGKIVFFLVSTYSVYSIYFKFSSSVGDYVSLYFYSAVFQGNAALITLSSMFVIYKKQILNDEIARLENIIANHLKDVYGVSGLYKDVLCFKGFPDKLIKDLDVVKKASLVKLRDNDAWKSRFKDFEEIIEERELIWKKAFKPVKYLLLVAMVCSLLLISVTAIQNNAEIEFLILDVVFCFETLGLLSLINFIKEVV